VPEGPGPWTEEEGYRWRELVEPSGEEDGFTLMPSGSIGVDFTNILSEDEQTRNRILGQGSGVAWGDVDGDGWPDLFLPAIEGGSRLFLNRGGWRFRDATDDSGIELEGVAATSAVFADIDGDTDLDLFVGALESPNHLFINDGNGHFSDESRDRGLAENRGAMTAAMADVDGDGDLDLYVANNRQRTADDIFHPADRGFDSIIVIQDGRPVINPRHADFYRVSMDPSGNLERTEIAEPDDFYLNDGNGNFERVPFDGGRFLDDRGRPFTAELENWALAARFQDWDGDGDPDLYVANDFEDNEHIWINQGDGSFRMVSWETFATTSAASMAVDFSDVDRNGTMDVFVVDMLATHRERFHQMRQLMEGVTSDPGTIHFRTQRNRNTLFLQRPDGTFQEMANFAGVQASDWSWGTLFLDVDLDGFEDLLIGNGYQWDQQNIDLNRKLAMERDREWERMILRYPTLLERNVAFRNQGDSTFARADSAWGWGAEPDISQGIALADVDGDGDLDVAVNRLNDPAQLFRNDARAPRLAVRLRGAGENTRAIGARIRVLGGPVPVQIKEVTAGGLYLSHAETLYSFAAGEAETLTIEVAWRDGDFTRIEGVRPGRLYEIDEPARTPEVRSAGARTDEPATTAAPDREDGTTGAGTATDGPDPVLFEEVSERLGPAQHTDIVYDDFALQPLLPMKLSQLGPGVSWHDWDGDGDSDLLVSGGRGGELTVHRNREGAFSARPLHHATADQTAVIPVAGVGLLVGQMNYEAPDPDSAYSIPGLLAVSERGVRPLVDLDYSSSGPVAVADVDGDGNLDAFLGGRVIPGAYPAPASSRLLLNQGGTLAVDSVASEPFRQVGLVSGAVFSDVDGDGDPDLLLAVEWGPVKLVTNEGGRFREATEEWGLDAWSGRWNGVNAIDADGDGRMDVVATGWGLNTSYGHYTRISREHPLRIYGWNFDADEYFDVVEAYWDPEMDAYVPRARLERLTEGMRFLQQRGGYTHEAYAETTVEELLGRALDRALVLEAWALEHMLFLNRGDHFEATPLPVASQLAPAFHAGVADLNGDGAEDLFLGQNFHPTERDTFRFDSGQGLVLLGDGEGGFRPLPSTRSGIEIYGEQRGAAFSDFDEDGRVDLAVSQNGAATRLFRNRGAKPGLRVRLDGPRDNPVGIGARLRVVYTDGSEGPAREIHGGAGYWSYDDPVAVLGLRSEPAALRVRWPDGEVTTAEIEPDQRTIVVRR